MPEHKFLAHTKSSEEYTALLDNKKWLQYLVDVHMDDNRGLTIVASQKHLNHVANSIMCTIHDS